MVAVPSLTKMAVHGTNEWLVFDDSKLHKAANETQVIIL